MARFRPFYTAALLAAAALSGGCSGSDNAPVQPSAPTYQELGPFSDSATSSLAPVKRDGKWGFIDSYGSLVIGARYSRVLPFSEGLAGVDESGLWGFINTSGALTITPKFSTVAPFSESLATAKSRSREPFGFINKQGSFAIQPQFEKALSFSQGLAPVYKDSKWQYIDSAGSVVLTTNHYRAYRFTTDGLALVKPQQNGKYGFMARDGSMKLPAIYDEAFEFSNGLAPVRFGSSWTYIDTGGKYAIADTYQFATPFSEGVAAVMKGGKFFYITPSGGRIHTAVFDSASPFIGGKALVRTSDTTYYIDKSGSNLGIAQKLSKTATARGGTGCVESGVWNSYQGGFVKFSLVNTDTGQWNISYTNTMTCDGCTQPLLIPGGTAILPANKATGDTTQSFMAYFPSGAVSTSGPSLPHFNMNLTSADGKAVITVANSTKYNAPPPAETSMNWFDFLKGAVDIIKGTLDLADGDIFGGLYDFASGSKDMVTGATGDAPTGNQLPPGTGTFYVSKLSGTYNGQAMSPVGGDFCGGDSYAISDSSSLVVEMSASRASSVPGEVDLKFYQYNTFFGLQSLKRFNDWRDPSNGTQYLTGDYAKFMARVFANPSDPNDTTVCQSPDKSQGFMQSVRDTNQISYSSVYDLFDFANNFDLRCNMMADSSGQTWCQYWAAKFPYSCSSESLGLNPLALTMGSQTGPTCTWSVAATNSQGPLTATTSLNGVTFSPNTCTSAQKSCSFTLSAPLQANGVVTISDGWNTVPLAVQCVPPPMTANPSMLYAKLNNFSDAAVQQVTMSNTQGTVTASQLGSVSFKNISCTGKQNSCMVTIACTGPTAATINLTDGTTTLPFPVSCQ